LSATVHENRKSKLTEFTPASAEEVVNIINKLDVNTSSGLDGITLKSLKCVKNLIAEHLTNCFNKCLVSGYFPESLKLAKVTPIHKSSSKADPSNYRPISVLPALSKVLETLLHSRLERYLRSMNFLYEKQYGFRPLSNTLTATTDLVTKIKVSIDQREVVLGVFIDLKKAFDTISHQVLLRKLENIVGMEGTALKMFQSYLVNRRQIVKLGQYKSNQQLVTCGVPQGSILGPLLFLIYINDIYQIGLKGNISLYADDTCMFYYGRSLREIAIDAQHDLDLLNDWFQLNLLTINTTKSNYIIFAAKNKQLPNIESLKVANQPLKRVDQEKYLGLVLDKKLTWRPHIDKIKNKMASLTGSLRGIARCLPKRVRFTIYNTLVKPHIDYLIEIWGAAAATNLNLIQRAQNKLIKVLFKYDSRTPTIKIYQETNILNIRQSYAYQTCLLIHKIQQNNLHTQISFTKKGETQRMQLRNADNLAPRAPRTNYGKKCILYEGAILYNKLPRVIRNAKSTSTFKKLLKKHLCTST
jgi:hypothetical protein